MTTHKLLNNYVVCVPQSQGFAYSAVVPATRVFCHPDTIIGKPAKLNWCFDFFEDEETIVFLDDDLSCVIRCFTEPGDAACNLRDPDTIEAIIETTAQAAREAGAFFFGWSVSARDAMFYTGFYPFRFTGYINGTAMGFHRGHRLRFDEAFIGKADYDISCQNALQHRFCLRNLRYSFVTKKTFGAPGGTSALRNTVTEANDVARLKRKWGNVVTVNRKRAGNVRDRQGVGSVEIKFPF